ncbi:MAG: ATP synthase F1 subunit epsilon [Candidatus Cloacimonetes bacterium]|nr:ATP synthase F1 subunit epsilon [Candidatus Cloacimonadota bacterium]
MNKEVSANKIRLEIIQPTRILIQKEFEHIIVPGVEGEFGVSPGHTPVITSIRPGVVKCYTGTEIDHYVVHDGFVTVEADCIHIVCEIGEHHSEIDTSRAEQARQRAMERVNKPANSGIDFRRAEIALRRAIARLEPTAG